MASGFDDPCRNFEDSSILEELHFNQAVDRYGSDKLPRVVRHGQRETYESIYEVCEDVEKMLIAWRKRSTMPCGEKIHKSVKLYKGLFPDERDFNDLLTLISRVKAFLLDTILALFLQDVPNSLVERLPREVWKRIWRHAQGDSRNIVYFVGNKFKTEGKVKIEEERVVALFGSVGDIHMLLFEILFKVPRILDELPVSLIMDYVYRLPDSKGSEIASAKWALTWMKRNMEKNFHRLNDLLYPDLTEGVDDETNGIKAKTLNSIDQGRYFMQNQAFTEDEILPAMFFVLSEVPSDVIGIFEVPRGEVSNIEECLGNVVLYNVKENFQLGRIETGLNIFACFEENMVLTESYLAVYIPQETKDISEKFYSNAIYYWNIPNGLKKENFVLQRKDAFKISFTSRIYIRNPNSSNQTCLDDEEDFFQEKNCMKGKEEINGTCTFIVCKSDRDAERKGRSWVRFFDAAKCQELENAEMVFSNENVSLEWLKGERFMLKCEVAGEFLFCRFRPSKIIERYPFNAFCEFSGHRRSLICSYYVRVDHDPSRNEFLIFTDHFLYFHLLNYDDNSSVEDKTPNTLSVSYGDVLAPHMSIGVIESLKPPSLYLLDGVLFALTEREATKFKESPFVPESQRVCDVFALDCHRRKIHPIDSLIRLREGSFASEELLLNQQNRFFYVGCNDQPVLYTNCTSDLFILLQKSILSVHFEEIPEVVVEADAKLIEVKEAEDRTATEEYEKMMKKSKGI